MRDLGELWQEYQANPNDDWAYEKRILIDGEEYTETEIFSLVKQGGLILDDFNIGTCASMRLDCSIRPKSLLRPNIITISGAVVIEAAATEQYDVTVLDQFGGVMQGERVVWSLGDEYQGISIDETGLLTVDEDAEYGDIVVVATSETNPDTVAEFVVEIIGPNFAFVIYGYTFGLNYISGEYLKFTIDWGDGTQEDVDAEYLSVYHVYPSAPVEQEWTITIKNYVSGWITLQSTLQLRKVLAPFPPSETRTDFSNCFVSCYNLTAIPENLFANNPNATDFSACFNSCYALTTIPKNLFAHNPNVTRFSACFLGCKSLQNINLNLHADVLARENVEYWSMFLTSSTEDSAQGLAPEWWKLAATTSATGSCFRNNTALLNYDDIPAEWK